VTDAYSDDELDEIRTQAVWFPTDTRCPRNHGPMLVVLTFVFQVIGETDMVRRTVDGWSTDSAWERDEVLVRCDTCDLPVRAATGTLLHVTWLHVLEQVRDEMARGGRDPRIVGAEQRTLEVTIPVNDERFAYQVPVLWLASHPASQIAQEILEAYNQALIAPS
jgi:hypothetical protein